MTPHQTLIQEIKERAKKLVDDNYPNASAKAYLYTENAMLIGASIVMEKETEKIPGETDDGWNRIFDMEYERQSRINIPVSS